MNINILALVGISTASGAIAGGAIAAGFVNLQDVSPGTPQTGHINVTGNTVSGKFGSGVTPTLARVQVKETGTLQGVRAESNTGIAVFGTSTSTTGVAPGGHFTNKGPGAALIGDAQNTAGSTIGGLFTNRAANGAGAHARAIGAGNTATGLLAENTSSTGKAFTARNTGSNNKLDAGTPDDSLVTAGVIPRHLYAAGTPATMVPIAYGQLNAGGIQNGSGNFTFASPSLGVLEIDVIGFGPDSADATIVVTAQQGGSFEGATYSAGTNAADFNINTFNQAGDPVGTDVSFIVFMPVLSASPAMPEELRNPPGLRRHKGDDEAWAKADPKGYRQWLTRYREWQARAAAAPFTEPRPE